MISRTQGMSSTAELQPQPDLIAQSRARKLSKKASNLGILCTEEGGGVQVALALVAAEAVLVEEAVLRRNLLSLENSALAADQG